MANYGIIVAAGAGMRFGGLKQFTRLGGEPLVFYSLRAFERCPEVKEVVLVTNLEMIERAETLVHRWRLRKVVWVVAGGEQRQDSVLQGLKVLPEEGMVAIHDGARPFIASSDIVTGFRVCRKSRAVIYARSVPETVKEVDADGNAVRTIPRDRLVLVQTPQFFDLGLIKKAHVEARHDGFYGTDDAQLVERMDDKVKVLSGRAENVKVTTRDDLRYAEREMRHWSARASDGTQRQAGQ